MSPPYRIPVVGEFSDPVYLNAGRDLRGRELTVIMWRPDSSYVIRDANIGRGGVWEFNQTMLEHQWCYFLTEEGDLSLPGMYVMQLNVVPALPSPQLPQFFFQCAAS